MNHRNSLLAQLVAHKQFLTETIEAVSRMDPGLSYGAQAGRQNGLNAIGAEACKMTGETFAALAQAGTDADIDADAAATIADVLRDQFDDARWSKGRDLWADTADRAASETRHLRADSRRQLAHA